MPCRQDGAEVGSVGYLESEWTAATGSDVVKPEQRIIVVGPLLSASNLLIHELLAPPLHFFRPLLSYTLFMIS
jgi:hypothetical protein